jgi:hypothetical protein
VATALGDDEPAPAGQNIEAVTALGTAITYQGRLTDAGNPANGAYDIRFILYDADTAGAAVGSTLTKDDIAVTNGLFSTELDFGAEPGTAMAAGWRLPSGRGRAPERSPCSRRGSR